MSIERVAEPGGDVNEGAFFGRQGMRLGAVGGLGRDDTDVPAPREEAVDRCEDVVPWLTLRGDAGVGEVKGGVA